jgi:hypothetical protein
VVGKSSEDIQEIQSLSPKRTVLEKIKLRHLMKMAEPLTGLSAFWWEWITAVAPRLADFIVRAVNPQLAASLLS